MKILLLSSIFFVTFTGAVLSQDWVPLGSGTNGPVYAICGYNGDLIIGGNFGIAGGYTAYYIARWEGSNWAPMNGTLAPNGIVRTLAVYQGELIVGGDFGLRKWNGSQWSNFPGLPPTGPVYALAVWAFGFLFCGGEFTQIGGIAVSNIAMWNGSEWSRLGTANFYGTNGQVRAIEPTAISVYVGGVFGTAGGIQTGAVAEWYGGAWHALGNGVSGNVYTLCWALDEYNNNVYAGGYFTGGTATNIAKWDGSQWKALGTGTDGEVRAIARISPSEILIGGDFGLAGGITATRLAKWKWQENTWSALPDGGANKRVWAISNCTVDRISSVYTGGGFFTIGGNNAKHIA